MYDSFVLQNNTVKPFKSVETLSVELQSRMACIFSALFYGTAPSHEHNLPQRNVEQNAAQRGPDPRHVFICSFITCLYPLTYYHVLLLFLSLFFYSAVDEQEGTFFLNPGNCRFFPHSRTALILILKERLVFVSIWTFTSHPLCACTREVCLKSVQVYLLLPESAGTPQYGEETDVAKTQWAGVRCMEA